MLYANHHGPGIDYFRMKVLASTLTSTLTSTQLSNGYDRQGGRVVSGSQVCNFEGVSLGCAN
jgi:hypothetical protein